MEKQPRLSRARVLAQLREHSAKHGFVSTAILEANDKLVLRSIPLYFEGLAAARHVVGVSGPPYRKPKRRRVGKQELEPTSSRSSRRWARAAHRRSCRRQAGIRARRQNRAAPHGWSLLGHVPVELVAGTRSTTVIVVTDAKSVDAGIEQPPPAGAITLAIAQGSATVNDLAKLLGALAHLCRPRVVVRS